jgi:hypothetical protein
MKFTYYTNCFILPVKNILCSKLHCQKVLILITFLCKILLRDGTDVGETHGKYRSDLRHYTSDITCLVGGIKRAS